MEGNQAVWYCYRQRAGPLVKECRALRPRYLPEEPVEDRRDKAQLKRYKHGGFDRRQVDRLEIRLALLPQGTHYTLSYGEEHLPGDFAGVRRSWRAFMGRVGRWRGGQPLDYVYAIEGLHGDHRFHIHFGCSYLDLSPAEVGYLWRNGGVEDEPVLLTHPVRDARTGEWSTVCDGGYRRLAEYLNKERTDGVWIPIGRHPWGCSKSLNAKVPPVERWRDTCGDIEIPTSSVWARRRSLQNDFGAYNYATWIEAPDGLSY